MAKVPQLGNDLVDILDVGQALSAQQQLTAIFCLLLNLCGIVEVEFPSREHGMRGTFPGRS
jgi:hypothetical protein